MLGLKQLILISTDKGQDCFLITDRFQRVSWLSMPFCTFLSSCVQYFFPVSLHFITHNLISELICFVFFVCMDYLGCCRHLVKSQVNSTFRNIFTWKNGDVFNTYFTHCIYYFCHDNSRSDVHGNIHDNVNVFGLGGIDLLRCCCCCGRTSTETCYCQYIHNMLL